jgi:hypothetical protein
MASPIPLLLALVGAASPPVAQIPDGTLSVAYRRIEAGKLSEIVWYETLECWDGACTVATVAFQPCANSAAGKGYLVTVQTETPRGGGLTVSKVDDRTLAVEYRDSKVTISRRYAFSTITEPGGSGRRFFSALEGFSGAGVTTSMSGAPASWTLTPLKGAFVRLDRDCGPVLLSVVE